VQAACQSENSRGIERYQQQSEDQQSWTITWLPEMRVLHIGTAAALQAVAAALPEVYFDDATLQLIARPYTAAEKRQKLHSMHPLHVICVYCGPKRAF
jgi:hypothetical protein